MNKNKLNPRFQSLANKDGSSIDYLYHLGIDTSMDLNNIFGNVKYVVFTLSHQSAEVIATEFARNIYKIPNEIFSYKPIHKTERFNMYKVGVSIIISIGVGMQSLLICLNEITKLLVHIGKYDVLYFKIGLCGGIGIANGDIIVSNIIVDGKFESKFESIECGEIYKYPTIFDDLIAKELVAFANNLGHNNISIGTNLSTYSFNDEQARMNGAITPLYTSQEANQYLMNAYNKGIRSIDMESLAFAGFCNQLDIPGCVIGISVVDRLVTEDIIITMDMQQLMLTQFAKILINYIQTRTQLENHERQ